jgi:hypothetical protein
MGTNDAREQLEVCKQEYLKLERAVAALRAVALAAGIREELIERIINEA